jgi:hypothetical protein
MFSSFSTYKITNKPKPTSSLSIVGSQIDGSHRFDRLPPADETHTSASLSGKPQHPRKGNLGNPLVYLSRCDIVDINTLRDLWMAKGYRCTLFVQFEALARVEHRVQFEALARVEHRVQFEALARVEHRVQFSTVYFLLMFQSLLSVTEGQQVPPEGDCKPGRSSFRQTSCMWHTDRQTHRCICHRTLWQNQSTPWNAHDSRGRCSKKVQTKRDCVVETSLGLGRALSWFQTMRTELLLPMHGQDGFSTVDAGLLKDIQACSPN